MVKSQMYDDLSFAQRRELKHKYITDQENKCWYCGNDLLYDPPTDKVNKASINEKLFPDGFFTSGGGVHLQHDHSTGLTEGAVHARCNAYMWQYEGR